MGFGLRKGSFLKAAIAIVATVDGLRPSRAGLSLALNLPNPGRLARLRSRRTSARVANAIDDGFRLSLCQVVLGAIFFGDLIGSRHGRAPSSFNLARQGRGPDSAAITGRAVILERMSA